MLRVFRHYVPSPLLLLVTAETGIVFGSVFIGLALPLVGIPEIPPAWGSAIPAATTLALLVVVTCDVAGLHGSRRAYGRRELFLRLGIAFVTGYLAIAALGYFVHALSLGRKAYLLSFATSFPAAFAIRLLHDWLVAHGRRRQKVLLLGHGEVSRLIAESIQQSSHTYELIGCLAHNGGPAGESADLPCVGSIDDLDWIAKVTRPDVMVVALEERRGTLPVAEIVECKFRGIEVEDWPSFYEKLTGRIPISQLRPSWLVFTDGFKRPRLTLFTKRAIDVIVSLLGCLVSLPLMILIAVAIKRDSPGPVFFLQERTGQHGRIFRVVKFRSMRRGAHLFPAPPPGEPDPRVTRVGRFLRRTRLDELPQLFNVLRGDMSLVGPRPEWVALVPEFCEKVPLYLHRLAVKPGITGWAQVQNPYGATVENTLEKLQYDLYYIKNLSIFLDLLILLHTVQIVLFTRGSDAWTTTERPQPTTSASYVG